MNSPTRATTPVAKVQGCTNLKLRQLTRRVSQHYDSFTLEAGLKTTQYSLLSYIVVYSPIAPGELANHMHMEPSTLTRNLRPLIDAGWVSLEAGADARSRVVVITPEGRAKREEAKRLWKKAQESLNAMLGLEKIAALHALLDDSLQLFNEDTEVA